MITTTPPQLLLNSISSPIKSFQSFSKEHFWYCCILWRYFNSMCIWCVVFSNFTIKKTNINFNLDYYKTKAFISMTLLGKETCSRSFRKNRKRFQNLASHFHVMSRRRLLLPPPPPLEARSAGYRAVPAGAKSSTAQWQIGGSYWPRPSSGVSYVLMSHCAVLQRRAQPIPGPNFWAPAQLSWALSARAGSCAQLLRMAT